MAVSPVPIPTQEAMRDRAGQIEKIAQSHVFFGSETSCRLLHFLAQRSVLEPHVPLTEYEIATEAMGRRPDFDPRSDSCVRVQVARLRTKLAEYMTGEGLGDPYIVEVPRGSYRLTMTPNAQSRAPAPSAIQKTDSEMISSDRTGAGLREQSQTLPFKSRILKRKRTIFAFLALLTVAFIVLGRWARGYVHFGRLTPSDAAIREFWQPFLSDPQGPLTVISNAPFSGNPVSGLRYDPQAGDIVNVHSYYTGIGEAMSIHSLDRIFFRLGSPLRVRPGSLLSVEDVKGSNLIFIGAPVENLMIDKVVTLRHFDFREITSGARTGQVVIENRNPLPGEPPAYMASSLPDAPLVEDFALIARMPVDATHVAIVAAGTTTIGTEAAIDYLCQPDTLRQLRQRLGSVHRGNAYELILHIKIVDDVPMKAEIVTLRDDGKPV